MGSPETCGEKVDAQWARAPSSAGPGGRSPAYLVERLEAEDEADWWRRAASAAASTSTSLRERGTLSAFRERASSSRPFRLSERPRRTSARELGAASGLSLCPGQRHLLPSQGASIVQRPPPRPKHQSFLDGSWFSATPASLSGSPVPGGGRRHRPLTPRERGCAAHGPHRDARPAAVGWPACLPCRGRCQRRARPLTRSPAREPGSVVPVLTLARRLVGGLAGRPPRFPHSRLMRPPEAPAPPPGAGGFLLGAARRLWGAGCWLRARLQCRGPETAAWLDARPRPSRVSPGARCPPSVRTPRGPEGPSLGLEATRQLTRPDAPTGPSEQFQPRRPQTVTNTPTGRVAHDRPRPGREAAGVQSSQKRGTRPISGLRLPALRFLCQPRAPRLQATPQGPREQLRADSPRHFRNVTSQTGSDIFTRRCRFLRLPDAGRPPHQRPPLGPAQLQPASTPNLGDPRLAKPLDAY